MRKGGISQALHQLSLSLAPYRANGAGFAEDARAAIIPHAFIEHDRSVDGLDNLEQSDLLRRTGERDAPARPA